MGPCVFVWVVAAFLLPGAWPESRSRGHFSFSPFHAISRQRTAQTTSLLPLMILPLERNLWFCCLSRWPPQVETPLITPGLQCKGLSADINFCGCRCACALLCVLWDSKSQFVSLGTGRLWPSIFSSAPSFQMTSLSAKWLCRHCVGYICSKRPLSITYDAPAFNIAFVTPLKSWKGKGTKELQSYNSPFPKYPSHAIVLLLSLLAHFANHLR